MTPPTPLMSLLMRHNLHPELDLHPSWLPAQWPARYRQVARLGPAGQAVLSDLLRRDDPLANEPRFDFDSPLSRLALLDGPALRRLAVYLGLCAHKALLRPRLGGSHLRRQARRFDRDAPDFVLDRTPQLSELRMSLSHLQQRPRAAGRIIVDRGHRLLLALMSAEGEEALLQRVQRKLPRRTCASGVPLLSPAQLAQLREVTLQCLLPERLPQWDWLF